MQARESFAADACGGILIDIHGRVLLREPTDHHGGYVWTFPKGRRDHGETSDQTALREVREEVGYDARIVAPLSDIYIGTTTKTLFFLMHPVGRQGPYNREETASTQWVTFADAVALILQTRTATGRERDLTVLEAARKLHRDLQRSAA